jgi:hypothetical protein
MSEDDPQRQVDEWSRFRQERAGEWRETHAPAEPVTIGDSTGLVYCRQCCYLLSSDAKGRTARADQPCPVIPISLRDKGAE